MEFEFQKKHKNWYHRRSYNLVEELIRKVPIFSDSTRDSEIIYLSSVKPRGRRSKRVNLMQYSPID